MNLYIVRHCKAEGQPAEAPLTEEGFQQAKELAEFFTDKKIKRVVSSPFKRARQSIEPTAEELGLEVELDDRLAERILSSEPMNDWMEKLAVTFTDLHLKFKGGESSKEAADRATQVVDEIIEHGEDTVIVTHGNLMALLLKNFDETIGFETWRKFSNPDVYYLNTDTALLKRLWSSS